MNLSQQCAKQKHSREQAQQFKALVNSYCGDEAMTDQTQGRERCQAMATIDFNQYAQKQKKGVGHKTAFDIENYHMPMHARFGLWRVTGESKKEVSTQGRPQAMVPVECSGWGDKLCGVTDVKSYRDLVNGRSKGCASCSKLYLKKVKK